MAPSTGKFVCYYQVSTGKQGKSGLGIEAQHQAVKTYLNGGDWEIVAEFTEIESGKRSDRPALEKALAAARLHRASVDPLSGLPKPSTRSWRRCPLRGPAADRRRHRALPAAADGRRRRVGGRHELSAHQGRSRSGETARQEAWRPSAQDRWRGCEGQASLRRRRQWISEGSRRGYARPSGTRGSEGG